METRQREIVTIFIYEELDYEQVADLLNISELEVMMAYKNLIEELTRQISPMRGLPMLARINNFN